MEWFFEYWHPLATLVGSAILSTAFITGIAVLGRDAIRGWLMAKAKHHYDVQLEAIRAANAKSVEEMRAQFARELEGLKADLVKSGREMETLRAAPMGARAARQAQIDKRRLEAVDQLWNAVKDLAAGKGAASWMAVVKFETVADAAKTDQRVRDMFKDIANSLNLDKQLIFSGHVARPFVSPLAWALFSAYSAAIGMTRARLAVLELGIGAVALDKQEAVIKLLVEALPDWRTYIERFGFRGLPYVLDELERRLLAELQRTLTGEDDDAAEVDRAKKIIDRVNELDMSKSKSSIPAELRSSEEATSRQVETP